MPGATSGIFFSQPNHAIGIMASIKNMIKNLVLTPRHKGLCIEWSRKCIAVVMKTVLFTDGSMHEDDHA